jgi:hypothetical protein
LREPLLRFLGGSDVDHAAIEGIDLKSIVSDAYVAQDLA